MPMPGTIRLVSVIRLGCSRAIHPSRNAKAAALLTHSRQWLERSSTKLLVMPPLVWTDSEASASVPVERA